MASQSRSQRVCCGTLTISRYNIIMVSTSFLVLFSSYNALQNIATSLFPNGLGNQSLSVLYGTCAASVFFAPPIVHLLNSRYTMILAGTFYVIYMLSLIVIIPDVVLALSTVIGVGDILLWTAVGVFISQNSTRAEYGYNSGLFWSIFQLCNIIGNVAIYFVLSNVPANAQVYIGFSSVAAIGTGMLCFLRAPESNIGQDITRVDGEKTKSFLGDDEIFDRDGARSLDSSFSGVGGGSSSFSGGGGSNHNKKNKDRISSFNYSIKGDNTDDDDIEQVKPTLWEMTIKSVYDCTTLMFTRESLLLTPMYIFSGLELSFWSGEFSQFLTPSVIGLVLSFAGVGEVIGGIIFGKLSDKFGRSISITIGSICYAIGLGISCYMKQQNYTPDPQVLGAPAIAYAAALLFGLGDSSFNTNSYALVAQIWQTPHLKTSGHVPSSNEKTKGLLREEDEDGEENILFIRANGRNLQVSNDSEENDSEDDKVVVTGIESLSAFTIFMMWQNLGSGIGFFYAIPYPMHGSGSYLQAYVQFGLLVISLILFVIVDREQSNKDRKRV